MTYSIVGKVTGHRTTVRPDDLWKVVNQVAGRDAMQFKSVRDRLRRNGRVYIATAAGSVGRLVYGPGFIVERNDEA